MRGKRAEAHRNAVDLSFIYARRHRVALCLSRDLGLSFDGTLVSYPDLLGVKTEVSFVSGTVFQLDGIQRAPGRR